MAFLPYVREAIIKLKYVKPDYAEDLARLLEENPGIHPHALSTEFRKRGTPLTASEKRSLRIAQNAFYTQEARDSLDQRGLLHPMQAHEVTMLRAHFSFSRARTIADARAYNMDYIKASGAFADCPGCQSVKNKHYTCSEAESLPPTNCNHEACALWLMGQIDFLKDFR